jgi:hypothetical protein
MRRLKLVSMLGLTLGALALLAACGQGSAGNAPAGPGLTARNVSAGGVEVTITPVRIDSTGAVFEVAFDTHSGDLAFDIARASELEVDGTAWGEASWSGDSPGGHHRKGELRFRASGPAQGDVRLSIGGLPGSVEATWTLGS